MADGCSFYILTKSSKIIIIFLNYKFSYWTLKFVSISLMNFENYKPFSPRVFKLFKIIYRSTKIQNWIGFFIRHKTSIQDWKFKRFIRHKIEICKNVLNFFEIWVDK